MLDQQQEDLMVLRYDRYLGKLVNGYLLNTKMPRMAFWEDMMQEARLAFLQHIRKMPSESDVFLCKAAVVGALHRLREQTCLMRIPRNKFRQFAGRFEVVSIDVCEDVMMTSDDMTAEILVKCCIETLTPIERDAIEMRVSGYKYREIQTHLNLSTPMQAKRLVDEAADKLCKKLREDDADGYMGTG